MSTRRAKPKRAARTKPTARRKTVAKVKRLVRKAKRAVVKRVVARRVKRTVRKATKRIAKAKRTVGKAVKRAISKRAVRKAARSKRPPLALVKRPRPAKPAKPARKTARVPEPFAGAKAGASAKDLALFEFVRARVAVHAAVQGLAPASADAPGAPGKWSARETLLHLAYWDHEMWRAVEEAYQHNRRPHTSHEDIERINPDAIAALAHLDWESTKRLLQSHRERLLEALQSIPEEPAEMWSREHAVGWIVDLLTTHDRHHAEALREARARRDQA